MRKFLIPILTGLLVMALSTGAAWANSWSNPWGNSWGGQSNMGKMKTMQMQYKSMKNGQAQYKGYNFKDVGKNHWGYGSIYNMSAMGLFAGYGDGTFKPNQEISEAEMLTVLIRLVDETNVEDKDKDKLKSSKKSSRYETCVAFGKALEKNGYLKVDKNKPASLPFVDGTIMIDDKEVNYVLAMYKAGYIKGAPGNKFLPDNTITRAEMAAILERILADLKEALEDEEDVEDVDLDDLESVLLSDYKKIKDVRVEDISLKGGVDEVAVEIDVDLDKYEDQWAALQDSDITKWLKNLVADIQDELTASTRVSGEIINSDNDDVLVVFSKKGTKDLSVTYQDDDYRGDGVDDVNDVEAALKGDRFDVGGIEFKITSINYYDDDEITVELKAQEVIPYSYWNGLDSSDIEDDVEAVCAVIAKAFQDDADADPVTIFISLYDEGAAKLADYEYDVEDEYLY